MGSDLSLGLTYVDDGYASGASVAGLPNAWVDYASPMLHWTPTSQDAGKYYPTALSFVDNGSNSYQTDFITGGVSPCDFGDPVNLDFEEVCSGMPAFWTTNAWQPVSTFSADNTSGNVEHGVYSIKIVSTADNDAGVMSNDNAWIQIQPNTNYRLHGWIKTQGVTGATGAHIDVYAGGDYWDSGTRVTGTTAWTEEIFNFNSGTYTTLKIWCRLGHWGGWGDLAGGTAWFDNIWLEQLP